MHPFYGFDMAQDNKDNNVLEVVIISLIAFIFVVWLVSTNHIFAWYFIKTNLFKGLAMIPTQVSEIIFFYKADIVATFEPISNVLARYPAEAFSEFNHDEAPLELSLADLNKAIELKPKIDSVARWVTLPFFAIAFFVTVIMTLRVKVVDIRLGIKNAMYQFAEVQSGIWVYMLPIVHQMKEIAKEKSLDKGWYAMSSLPVNWMRERDLFVIIEKKRRKLFMIAERKEFALSLEKAYLAAKDTLGRPWVGLSDLSFDEKCLMFVLVPHVFGRVKDSRVLNRKLSMYHDGNPKITKKERSMMLKDIEETLISMEKQYEECFVPQFFNDAEFDEPYDPIVSSFEDLDSEQEMFDKGAGLIKTTLLTHNYVNTVFISIYMKSWTYGVLASAELIWVKKVSRELWYPMSQAGRNSSFIDLCGLWSHFLAEEKYGFKILTPQVQSAISAMDYDLWKTHANYIPHNEWEDPAKWDKLVPKLGQAGASGAGTAPGNVSSLI
jgi:hypothetical protein